MKLENFPHLYYTFLHDYYDPSHCFKWEVRGCLSPQDRIRELTLLYGRDRFKCISEEHNVWKIDTQWHTVYFGFKDLYSVLLVILSLDNSFSFIGDKNNITPKKQKELMMHIDKINLLLQKNGLELTTGFTDSDQVIEIL